ncbi:SMP-30/gluconolactonase/LRE family protein [Streptomyces sp. Z26]|uniref:SMP-30/gluconolactonase/LRE family protein n=1 Tax=Streptomyces sp. Z26 TaxID=2500177 RepID=UPI000EF14770|nr:SMP-30/gluconolactonase/LRE family protein [Streptomyces sp. Z26]RLL70390.1 SMP-30/gluconolactonase/LRE family protein [Streptomyces sp. Z26]
MYEVHDPRFEECALGDDRLETLYDGCRWAEGPLYVPAGRYLLWSDIPNDRLLRWDETTGAVGEFRAPAGFANGNTLDRRGRLVSCEQGDRRVTRTEHDGTVTVLADRHEGRRLNGPNDAAVRSDGSVWFSDPDFGLLSDYEGHRGESETGGLHVYRIDPATGAVRRVADGFAGPNGLVFSPDEHRLYVSDSRANHVRVFDVTADGDALRGDGEVFARCPEGRFDNIRFDDRGRLWAAALDGGAQCFADDGTYLGRVRTPEPVANLAFGGARRNRIFLTATTSLYSLVSSVTGPRPRFA